MTRIGLQQGTLFDPAALDQTTKAALEAGFEAGKQTVKAAVRGRMSLMNGWMVTKDMGYQAMNWLPAPEGDCRLVARFYGPKANLIDGAYPMPRPVRV